MGSYILRGIRTALMVTVLTLLGGIVWGTVGLGGLSVSRLVDIGLLASCLAGGYRTGKESGQFFMGGITGAGYVTVGTVLLALFLPIKGWGFVQIIAEGAIIGLVAGAIGAGGVNGALSDSWQGRRSRSHSAHFTPSYAGCKSDDYVGQRTGWDTEKNFPETENLQMADWIESSEGEFRRSSRAKRDFKGDTDVEWPGDQEKKMIAGPEYFEPLSIREPNLVRVDVSERNSVSLNNINTNKRREERPWWEE